MRMCWYSKCAMYVFSPSLCSSQLDKFARSKPKYLSGDKVFVYCPWAPLSVWRGSVSPVTPSHITCIFFSPSPVSWLYWRLKCSRSESVTLGDKKLVYTLLMPWYSNQLGPCPRVSDNWKENIHLIWRQQKTAAGRLNGFETDPNKSWWRIVAVSDWFRGFLFHSSSELNITLLKNTIRKRKIVSKDSMMKIPPTIFLEIPLKILLKIPLMIPLKIPLMIPLKTPQKTYSSGFS